MKTRMLGRVGALVAGSMIAMSLAVPAAHADAGATVMARTQRQADATLNSTLLGWYGVGTNLTLKCYKRGQAVQGYYSPYVGWDNLWYQTSDGGYVADVDINTGSNNPVTGACATTPSGLAATVMARTQRQSDATLNSTLLGWYTVGTRLSLKCYKRGQAVQGYYSPYVGWDNLWYQTSDGGYVADVDINTGSNNPVTGGCTTPPPPPASNKAQNAANWARSMVGSQAYGYWTVNAAGQRVFVGLCEKFAENAYGTGGKYASAIDARNSLAASGQIHLTGTPPVGALVFTKSSYDGGAGHVAIAVGNGQYVGGGFLPSYKGIAGGGSTVQLTSSPNPASSATYLGWAYAPSGWPGR